MNIFNYFLSLSEEINKINAFIIESENYKDIYNPFLKTQSKTYVWIETKDNV